MALYTGVDFGFDDCQALTWSSVYGVRGAGKATRQKMIHDFLERFSAWSGPRDLLPNGLGFVSSRKIDETKEEFLFVDAETVETYRIIRDSRNRPQNGGLGCNSDKNHTRSSIHIKAESPINEAYRSWFQNWVTEDSNLSVKQVNTLLCKSCKTVHEDNELDLIGRCSVKLASHHAKLRKIKNSHNDKNCRKI